jgi:isopenicillin N synthase-like dioxygenase
VDVDGYRSFQVQQVQPRGSSPGGPASPVGLSRDWLFAVQNHAVDESVMDAAWTASTDCFDLPMEIKLEPQKIYLYGYVQSERLTLGKELLVSTSNSSSSSSSSGGKVAVPVAASPALDLPPDWFQDKTDHHMSALRVFNHFAVDRVSENDDDGK